MDDRPQESEARQSRRSWLRNPLWIALGAVVTWAVLVVGSDQLWRHGFGFKGSDALALAVGLMAYVALMIVAAVVIAVGLINDGRRA